MCRTSLTFCKPSKSIISYTSVLIVVRHSIRFLLSLSFVLLLGLTACDSAEECVPRDGALLSEDILVGDGQSVVASTDSVYVYYVGTLENGDIFDDWVVQDGPEIGLSFGRLIEGWKQGLVGMKEGGRRKLTIPPTLAYGCDEVGSIPPNSTLVFDIRLGRLVQP